MHKFIFLMFSLGGLFFALTGSISAQSERSEIDHIRHYDELTGLTVTELETPNAMRGSKRVTFSTLGRAFELEISPTRLYTPDAKIRWVTESGEYVDQPESRHYKGRIPGEEGSWARMIVTPETMEAIIRSGDEIYFVRPGNRLISTLSPRTLLAYRLSDVDSLWDEYSCALDYSVLPGQKRRSPNGSRSAMDDFQAVVKEAQIQAETLSLKEVEIHVVADGAYYSAHGSGAAARMESVINDMAGIYENEVGVTYRISASTIYTPATDPFTSSTDPGTLLDSFTGTSHSSGHDLAHLFTGRDMAGSVVGIAWLGVVCHGTHNTGLSQDLGSATYRMLVTTHEVGHNFDAIHDGSNECSSTLSGYIMWPSLNPAATTFSDCSKSAMNTHIASRNCLSEAAPPGPLMEIGSVAVDHSWKTVGLDSTFTDPIVIAGPPSYKGGDPSVVRLRNVTSSSFEIRIQEWGYLDGSHIIEQISYLVMEAGQHQFEDGTLVEAGKLNTSNTLTKGFVQLSLTTPFSTPPVVFASVV